MSEPQVIMAGNTYDWTRTFSDYPADSWALAYEFVNGSNSYTIAGVPNGTAFDVTIDAATSATFATGSYKWFAFASQGDVRRLACQGSAEIIPDPTLAPTDYRTDLEQLYDALMAAYKELTTTGAMEASVSIGERAVTYRDRASLWQEIARVKQAMREEKIAAGLKVPGAVRVRFT